MTGDGGLLLYLFRDCVFKVADRVQPPKAGSLFFCRHLSWRAGDRVLEIGTGMGLAAVLAARAGCHVVATDVVPEAVRCARDNAVLNGVADRMEVRLGDGFDPVSGMTFHLICTSPPQMPTPPGRERDDPVAAADNGGPDGWALLDRVIGEGPRFLEPAGRLVFSLFGFLGVQRALARLRAVGLEPSILAREIHAFPRIGYERLEHIRSLDAEGSLPADRPPTAVERYLIQGVRRP